MPPGHVEPKPLTKDQKYSLALVALFVFIVAGFGYTNYEIQHQLKTINNNVSTINPYQDIQDNYNDSNGALGQISQQLQDIENNQTP